MTRRKIVWAKGDEAVEKIQIHMKGNQQRNRRLRTAWGSAVVLTKINKKKE